MDCAVCCLDMLSGEPPEKKQRTGTNNANATDVCCTPCGHIFHKKCLTEWFTKENAMSGLSGNPTNGTCPTCRRSVNLSELYPLYFTTSTSQSSSSQSVSSKSLFSNQNSTSTTDKSDETLRVQLLQTDLETMRQKWLDEKERADFNQAIINSLARSNDDEDDNMESSTYSGFDVRSDNYSPIDNDSTANSSTNDDTNGSDDVDDDDDDDDYFI